MGRRKRIDNVTHMWNTIVPQCASGHTWKLGRSVRILIRLRQLIPLPTTAAAAELRLIRLTLTLAVALAVGLHMWCGWLSVQLALLLLERLALGVVRGGVLRVLLLVRRVVEVVSTTIAVAL